MVESPNRECIKSAPETHSKRKLGELLFIYNPENLFIKPIGLNTNATGHTNLLSQLTAVATSASPH